MEITITKKVDTIEKINIELPAYYKTLAHQFKIISEQYCIFVTQGINNISIQKSHSELPFNVNAIESTEQEFNDAFMNVSQQLKNLIK
jgi:hypothetical protein